MPRSALRQRRAGLILIAGVFAASACSRSREATHSTEAPAPRARLEIAVLGDSSRAQFVATMARGSDVRPSRSGGLTEASISHSGQTFHFASADGEKVAPHASLAARADAALICVDARTGPLPIAREHVLLARQMRVPEVVIAFTHSDQIDDAELLELEEREMRELFNAYTLPGDDAASVFDDARAPGEPHSRAGRGPRGVLGVLSEIVTARPSPAALVATSKVEATVYALVPVESFRRTIASALLGGPAKVVVRGRELGAVIATDAPIAPGENGTLRLALEKETRVLRGDRFVVLREGHIYAAGTITKIR